MANVKNTYRRRKTFAVCCGKVTWGTSKAMAWLLFEEVVKMDLEGIVCKHKDFAVQTH
jgi:hypothetical protein